MSTDTIFWFLIHVRLMILSSHGACINDLFQNKGTTVSELWLVHFLGAVCTQTYAFPLWVRMRVRRSMKRT